MSGSRALPDDLDLARFEHVPRTMPTLGNHRSGSVTPHQAIVWIDDHKACILRMDSGLVRESTIHADGAVEPAKETIGSEGQARTPGGYFHRVARAIDIADEILIAGPSNTKLDFARYMHKDDHAIDPRILGVETIADPTDIQLAAFAKLYFTEGGPRRAGHGNGSGFGKAE